MRVGIVAQAEEDGGAEGYLRSLYAGLKESGLAEPYLIGSVPGWRDLGLEAIDLRFSRKWSRRTIASGIVKLPYEIRSLKKFLGAAGHCADVFHVQFKREQVGFSRLLTSHAPVVWTEHGRMNQNMPGSAMNTWYREAAKYSACIVAVSSDVARDVRRVVGPHVRVEVIENCVDTARFRVPIGLERYTARESLDVSPDVPVLVWVGRLHRSKRPDWALSIADSWPGVVLLAGSGPMEDEIRRRSARRKNVRYLGRVDPVPLYLAADVMAFTSDGVGEGFPTTILEAAACGVPTVASSDSGAGVSSVEASGGELVDPSSNSREWTNALLRVAGSESARFRAAEWGSAHSQHQWLAEYRALYDDICSQ